MDFFIFGDSVIPHLNMIFYRQWLFRRRRQFALGIYFAVIIHVCLYSQICYYRTSDSGVVDRALVLRYQGIGFKSQLARALKERQCIL